MISQEHAVWRIGQISDICITRIHKEQELLNSEIELMQESGLDVEPEDLIIDHNNPSSFYYKWNRLIEFYSQFI